MVDWILRVKARFCCSIVKELSQPTSTSFSFLFSLFQLKTLIQNCSGLHGWELQTLSPWPKPKLSSFSLYLTLSLYLSSSGDSLLFPLSWPLTPFSTSLSLFNYSGEVLGMVICRFKVWSKTYSCWFCMKLYSPTLTMCI